jgi:hypothetical protein
VQHYLLLLLNLLLEVPFSALTLTQKIDHILSVAPTWEVNVAGMVCPATFSLLTRQFSVQGYTSGLGICALSDVGKRHPHSHTCRVIESGSVVCTRVFHSSMANKMQVFIAGRVYVYVADAIAALDWSTASLTK